MNEFTREPTGSMGREVADAVTVSAGDSQNDDSIGGDAAAAVADGTRTGSVRTPHPGTDPAGPEDTAPSAAQDDPDAEGIGADDERGPEGIGAHTGL